MVELIPTAEQEKELRLLMVQHSDAYRFTTAEEIISLEINIATGFLEESIGDHAKKTIQENEGQLMKVFGVGKRYTVGL